MSGPYVYKPTAPVRYAADFQNTPYYVHTPRTGTPFIPDSALYPTSPYSNPNSLPASPNRSNVPLPAPNPPNRYAFPTVDYESDYGTPWERYQRERRPSWRGANDDQWLQTPPTYPLGAGFQRRHSFGASGYPPPPQVHRGSLSTFYINPWINGEAPRADFYFDLALPSFTPLRIYASGQSDLLPHEELIQPATHPPITLLRIVCDTFPQWPMELRLDPYVTGYNSPPITLSDVLVAVHRNMHKQITHADWRKLTRQEEIEVARAFTRRCHANPSAVEQERVKGVKRVDYLLGKTRMAGLMNLGRSDGWEVMKLVVI